MKTIAFMAQKGGSGKTTLVTNLYAYCESQKKIAFDCDPQGSFSGWAGMRGKPEEVIALSALEIEEKLTKALGGGYEWAFVDTAPHAEAGAGKIAELANLAVIPVVPSVFDLMAVGGMVNILEAVDCPAVFVLNKCTPRTSEIDQAVKWLNERYPKIPVADVFLFNRIVYPRAALTGQGVSEFDPSGAAKHEISRLWENIQEFIQ